MTVSGAGGGQLTIIDSYHLGDQSATVLFTNPRIGNGFLLAGQELDQVMHHRMHLKRNLTLCMRNGCIARMCMTILRWPPSPDYVLRAQNTRLYAPDGRFSATPRLAFRSHRDHRQRAALQAGHRERQRRLREHPRQAQLRHLLHARRPPAARSAPAAASVHRGPAHDGGPAAQQQRALQRHAGLARRPRAGAAGGLHVPGDTLALRSDNVLS